jgi:ADP-ribosylglycohydrolase
MSTERASAILLGLALGDALGYPVEFLPIESIRQRYGANGITEPPDPALYTDDTQMTIAVAQALVDAGTFDLDAFMQTLGRQFIDWLHLQADPYHRRAPGNTCLAGVRNFERGLGWRESGVMGSKGCGSAMRVAPIGYFFQHQPDRLKEVALASGIITHGHPTAQAASVAAAYMVKLALDGIPPSDWFKPILDFTDGISAEFDAAILRVGHVEGWGNRDAALQHIGEGWVAEEAVALALYCLRQHPDDYVAAVRLGANLTGDSDSVACIAGGISAARLGLESIPLSWQDRCENRQGLLELGAKLAETREKSS